MELLIPDCIKCLIIWNMENIKRLQLYIEREKSNMFMFLVLVVLGWATPPCVLPSTPWSRTAPSSWAGASAPRTSTRPRPNKKRWEGRPKMTSRNILMTPCNLWLILDTIPLRVWFKKGGLAQIEEKSKFLIKYVFQLLKFALARMIPDFIESNECFEGTLIDKTKSTDKNETEKNEIEKVLEKVQVMI